MSPASRACIGQANTKFTVSQSNQNGPYFGLSPIDLIGLGDVEVKNPAYLTFLFVLGGTWAVAPTTPVLSQSFDPASAKKLVAPILQSQQQRVGAGACNTDLSIESIEMQKTTPTGVTSIRMNVRNVGSETFSSAPVYAKAVIEMRNGAANRTTQRSSANVTVIRPGASFQSSVTLRRSVFNGFRSGDEIRVSLVFSPGAPRCGLDADASNDQLTASYQQVRDWLNGGSRIVFVRR